MTLHRRQFSTSILGAGLGLALNGAARAQAAEPVEGKQFMRLSQPQPTAAPTGKIEVVEFFWYACPHCNEFEPMLESWVRKLPADVAFRRVPVAFREVPFVAHQRIYYALETLGKVDPLHKKVFAAIHVERKRLDKPEEIADFMQAQGIDRARFLEVYDSFGVQTKARQAKALAEAYRIDGVPALGINGQYYTSGSLAGSLGRSLEVADFLIQRSRKS